MKIVALPIDVVAWFTKDGVPNPIKFRVTTENKNAIVKINKVIAREIERKAGNKMYKFICQSVVNGIEKPYELKFETESSKWILYKI